MSPTNSRSLTMQPPNSPSSGKLPETRKNLWVHPSWGQADDSSAASSPSAVSPSTNASSETSVKSAHPETKSTPSPGTPTKFKEGSLPFDKICQLLDQTRSLRSELQHYESLLLRLAYPKKMSSTSQSEIIVGLSCSMNIQQILLDRSKLSLPSTHPTSSAVSPTSLSSLSTLHAQKHNAS